MSSLSAKLVMAAALAICAGSARAQMLPNPYGTPITVDQAKKAAAGAVDEARRNNWKMAITVVDPNGELVYFERMDNTQMASSQISIDKARSAARYKRPTRALQDVLAAGGAGLRMLALEGAVPVEGGIPILIEGKIAGAIGVSGDTSENDGICAQAGVRAVTGPPK